MWPPPSLWMIRNRTRNLTALPGCSQDFKVDVGLPRTVPIKMSVVRPSVCARHSYHMGHLLRMWKSQAFSLLPMRERIPGGDLGLTITLSNLLPGLCLQLISPKGSLKLLISAQPYFGESLVCLMPSILIKSLSQVSRNANTNFGFIKSSGFSGKSDLSGELYHIGFLLCCHYNWIAFSPKGLFWSHKKLLKKINDNESPKDIQYETKLLWH